VLTATADSPSQPGKAAPVSMGPLGSFFAIRKDGNLQEKEWDASVKQMTCDVHITQV